MIKKITIIGTHSAGKTTLSYALAYKFKTMGHSVKIIQEVARSCPYEINEGMGKETCLWIYHEHIRKELEAIRKFDMIICDRSAIDSFMYADVKNCFDYKDASMQDSYNSALHWMRTYHKILYVSTNDDMPPAPDGVRSVDLNFQREVEIRFEEWVDLYQDALPISIITSEMIFDAKKLDEIFKLL